MCVEDVESCFYGVVTAEEGVKRVFGSSRRSHEGKSESHREKYNNECEWLGFHTGFLFCVCVCIHWRHKDPCAALSIVLLFVIYVCYNSLSVYGCFPCGDAALGYPTLPQPTPCSDRGQILL